MFKSVLRKFFKKQKNQEVNYSNVIKLDCSFNLSKESEVTYSNNVLSFSIEKVYAGVVLMDDKIIKWKISNYKPFSEYNGGTNPSIQVLTKEFIARNSKERGYIFDYKAPHWISQWRFHKNYQGMGLYESPIRDLFRGR